MGLNAGSPVWRVALLLLPAMFLVECREIGAVPPRVAFSSWASCQQTVCGRIRDEAEGLARLKLLRGYVTETVKLLDSLMDSMDSELVGIATEMKDFVGPRCESAHQMLQQVAEVMPARDFELSAGIMEESTVQRVVDAQTSGRQELGGDIEQQGYDSDLQGWSSPDSDFGNYSPGTDRQSNSGQSNSGQSSFSNRKGIEEQESSSSSTSSSLGWGVENTDNSVYSEEDTLDRQQGWRAGRGEGQNPASKGKGRQLDQGSQGGQTWGSGGGGGSKGGSQRHNSAGETYQTSSSNQYNSAVSHTGSSGSRVGSGGGGSSSSWRPVPTGPNCRGRRGSPYAVPGIDDWCLQNCARGYCPQTHCSCD